MTDDTHLLSLESIFRERKKTPIFGVRFGVPRCSAFLAFLVKVRTAGLNSCNASLLGLLEANFGSRIRSAGNFRETNTLGL